MCGRRAVLITRHCGSLSIIMEGATLSKVQSYGCNLFAPYQLILLAWSDKDRGGLNRMKMEQHGCLYFTSHEDPTRPHNVFGFDDPFHRDEWVPLGVVSKPDAWSGVFDRGRPTPHRSGPRRGGAAVVRPMRHGSG